MSFWIREPKAEHPTCESCVKEMIAMKARQDQQDNEIAELKKAVSKLNMAMAFKTGKRPEVKP